MLNLTFYSYLIAQLGAFAASPLSRISTVSARGLSLALLCFLALYFPLTAFSLPNGSDGPGSEQWNDRTYYEILELDEEADLAAIKSSFRRLAMIYHPDHNPGNLVAEDQFKAIAEAYSVLSDEVQRAAYDLKLAPKNPVHHPRSATSTPRHHQRAQTYKPTPEEIAAHELDELFVSRLNEILNKAGDQKPNSVLVEELGRQIWHFYGHHKSVQLKALVIHHLLEDPVGSFLMRGAIRYWQLHQSGDAEKNIQSLRTLLQLAYFNLEKWAHTSGVAYSKDQMQITKEKELYIERLLAEIQELEAITKPQESILSRSIEACKAYLRKIK